jgi:hypothetical protein
MNANIQISYAQVKALWSETFDRPYDGSHPFQVAGEECLAELGAGNVRRWLQTHDRAGVSTLLGGSTRR